MPRTSKIFRVWRVEKIDECGIIIHFPEMSKNLHPPVVLPTAGLARDEVFGRMAAVRDQDTRWRDGRTFSLVFYAGEEMLSVLKEAYTMFFSENGLNPGAFPSLKKFESEVLSMTMGLLGGDSKTAGNMTSGGTESILMAVKTARQKFRAERPDITEPEILVPVSAHPAFDKAGHYFDVKIRHIPIGADFRADVAATAAAITDRTIMLVGSAPQYPQGVVDPIQELAALASENGLLMHTDACVGGMMLPFVRKLGFTIPDFDFRVPGVTSMSVDLHKYGYAAKGASCVLYRDKELRRHQYFVYTEWPGGIYASPTVAGTRPGGAIAAAWAIMNFLGEEGYLKITQTVMDTVKKIREKVREIDGVKILGEPNMSVMCLAADDPSLDIYEVGDEMSVRGWHLDRQQYPASLHLTVNWAHSQSVDQFTADLEQAITKARRFSLNKLNSQVGALAGSALGILPENMASGITRMFSKIGGSGLPKRSAAMYGMMGNLPNRGDLQDVVKDLLDKFTDATKK